MAAHTTGPMRHTAAANFVKGVATGMTMHGPTSDGNMHLTFFHDTAFPLGGDIISSSTADRTTTQIRQGAEIKDDFEIVRHNIATISVRQDQIEAMGKAFMMVAEQRAKAAEAHKASAGNAGIPPNVTP